MKTNNKITKWQITPSKKNLKLNYQALLDQIEVLRGRKLLFPYIGSGRGQGVYVELLDGSIKMDLLTGVGVQILGHNHPEIKKASLTASYSNILMQGHLLLNQEYLQLCHKLVSLAKRHSRLAHVWLTTSGSMANENALKMARQKNKPRRKILAFDKAFAGRSTLMAEITANPKTKEGLPSYNEVLRIPFYNPKKPEQSLQVLKSHLEKNSHDICAFIFEIILGEGGYKSAPREFFISLFEECRSHKIALWADEVQTFLRTGEIFAFEKWQLGKYIDLCTVGKGLQLAATLFTPEYKPKPGLVSGTFSATTSALIAGLKVLEVFENYTGKKVVISIEEQMTQLFKDLKQKNLIKDYDVFGLMAAFSLKQPENTQLFLQKLFQNGVIGLSCGDKNFARVRFLLPVVITENDIQTLKTVLINTLSE